MTVLLPLLIAAIVTVHVIWIGIVLAGTPLAVAGKLQAIRYGQAVFLVTALLTALNRVSGLPCLLTLSEQQLRRMQSGGAYSTGFIEHALASVGIAVSPDTMFLATSAWIAVGVMGLVCWQLNASKTEGKPLWA